MGERLERLVYRRDASFTSGKPSGKLPRFHWPSDRRPHISACGRVWLDPYTASDPDAVRKFSRCGAPGCAKLWAEHALAAQEHTDP